MNLKEKYFLIITLAMLALPLGYAAAVTRVNDLGNTSSLQPLPSAIAPDVSHNAGTSNVRSELSVPGVPVSSSQAAPQATANSQSAFALSPYVILAAVFSALVLVFLGALWALYHFQNRRRSR
jgi:hypothetical protein